MSGDKRCQGCQSLKGAKGAWVKSSEGLLGDRVFVRTHFRSSLTPEEGPSCFLIVFIGFNANAVLNSYLLEHPTNFCISLLPQAPFLAASINIRV